jgi:hypothetical protein
VLESGGVYVIAKPIGEDFWGIELVAYFLGILPAHESANSLLEIQSCHNHDLGVGLTHSKQKVGGFSVSEDIKKMVSRNYGPSGRLTIGLQFIELDEGPSPGALDGLALGIYLGRVAV